MSGSDGITVNTFAFFSEKAAKQNGHSVYVMADGTEIDVTSVYSSEEEGMKSYKWDDKVFVGQVDRWVRSVPSEEVFKPHMKEEHKYIDRGSQFYDLRLKKQVLDEKEPSLSNIDKVVSTFMRDINNTLVKLSNK